MNISQRKTLDLELKILKILEITLSLRQRCSMMPASLQTLRHAIIMYCSRYRDWRAPKPARTAGRDSKSTD